MFNWKIIIILIVLKVLSIIFAHYYINNKIEKEQKTHTINVKIGNIESIKAIESEKEICVSIIARNFMVCWIKYTIDTIDCSKAIIKKLPDFNNYHTNLENTKEELFTLFSSLYKNTYQVNKFKNIINQQISLKLSLSYAIKDENKQKIKLYTELLITNTHNLGILFSDIQKIKKNELELKESLISHTNIYIKSLGEMKKATNIELTRELVLGSISTVKLLL